MRLFVTTVAIGTAVATALVSASIGRSTGETVQDVTLRVIRYYDATSSRYRVRFSGTISPGRADEYVTVMMQRCGSGLVTAAAGAVSRPDGSWEDTYRGFAHAGTATYHARWRGESSRPVVLRGMLQPMISKRGTGQYRFWMTADSPLGSRMVELQRLAAGRWVRVRRIALETVADAGHTSYLASFTVRKRGLTMRVVVSASAAGACYARAASQAIKT